MSQPAFKAADAIALLILATASIIGINQYTYGLYNHCITIPFIKSLLHPELYSDDYLIAELKYFYSLFLPACSFLIGLFESSLPATFFLIYSVSLYATFVAFFLITLRLFERRDVAYFATMFLVFSFTTLGHEKTVENILMERTLALPLLLFSIYAFLGRHFNTAALLVGIAFLIHPLSASYVIAMLITSRLYQVIRERSLRDFLIGTGILAVIISPLLIMKFQNPAPGLKLIHASSEWIDLLWIRSPHHIFPSSWDKLAIIQALTLVAGFIIAWKYKPRQEYHRIVVISFASLLGLFTIGTVFTEIIPVSIVIQFQLFRSFKLLAFFAIIYYANFMFAESNSSAGIARKLLVTALIISPYIHEGIAIFTGLMILVMSVLIGPSLPEKTRVRWKGALIPAQLIMLAVMGIIGSMNQVHFTIRNAQDPSWLSVQEWAKQNTPIDAAFIVPPNLEGFRVESERTLYGEWKDGTQMFFDPLFGTEWIRRMKMLGYDESKPLKESYNELDETELERVADEMKPRHSKIFAVIPIEREKLHLPEVYSNDKFSVYEISSVQVVDFNLIEDSTHELVAQSTEIGN